MKRFLPYIVLTCLLISNTALGQTTEPTDTTTWLKRKRLSNNWGGFRSKVENRGISIDLQSTNFYQGLISGTNSSSSFEYGGRFDLYFNLDTKKLGLWKGGRVITHTEYRYESMNAYLGGTTLPTNLSMAIPITFYGSIVVSSLYYKQQLGENLSLSAGKINTIDLFYNHFFFGGYGNFGFMNYALSGLPNGVLPIVVMGTMADLKTGPLIWNLMVYDPTYPMSVTWPTEIFQNGVNYSLGTTWNTKWAGRSTSLNMTGVLSNKKTSFYYPNKPLDSFWYGSFMFSHLLHENENKPGNGWGVSLKTGVAGTQDYKASQFRHWITGGIGGKGFFPNRPEDRFGIGYFYHRFNTFAADPGYDKEQGVEVFYNYALMGWFNLSMDFQLVNPANVENKNSFSAGLRASIRF